MIHESHPWKAALAKDADLIERWAAKKGVAERRSFLIERKVFLAAYAMRKLDDATKLSTDLLASTISVPRFPPVREGYSEINNYQFDEFFDMANPIQIDLRGRHLLNLLIHSLVFVEVLGDEETYDAFMVTSDHEQDKGLVQVSLTDFIGLMRLAANDYPTEVEFTRGKKGEWIKRAGRGKLPSM
jgi:hypothetical protein